MTSITPRSSSDRMRSQQNTIYGSGRASLANSNTALMGETIPQSEIQPVVSSVEVEKIPLADFKETFKAAKSAAERLTNAHQAGKVSLTTGQQRGIAGNIQELLDQYKSSVPFKSVSEAGYNQASAGSIKNHSDSLKSYTQQAEKLLEDCGTRWENPVARRDR